MQDFPRGGVLAIPNKSENVLFSDVIKRSISHTEVYNFGFVNKRGTNIAYLPTHLHHFLI